MVRWAAAFAQACGMALAMRMDGISHRWVYVVMSDGEQDEGNVWEAAMLAGKYKLSNLVAITDRNNIQIDGPTEHVMPLENLRDKWEAFGWHVIEINGNDIEAVIEATYGQGDCRKTGNDFSAYSTRQRG